MTVQKTTKKKHRSGIHPTEVVLTDASSAPVSAATAQKLLGVLGLTEGEAQALVAAAASPATPDELAIVLKIDVDALAHALDEATVHALATDPVLELPPSAKDFEEVASRIRIAASGVEKLQHCIDDLHGATRVDADTAQRVISDVVPKLRARIRSNPIVRTTYGAVLAYQAHRFPGRHGAHAAPAPAPVPAPAPASAPAPAQS